MIIQKAPFPIKWLNIKKRRGSRRALNPTYLPIFFRKISAPLPSQGGLKKISTV